MRDDPAVAILDWLAVADVARRLGITTQWVRQLARRGAFRTLKTRAGMLYDPASIAEFERARAAR